MPKISLFALVTLSLLAAAQVAFADSLDDELASAKRRKSEKARNEERLQEQARATGLEKAYQIFTAHSLRALGLKTTTLKMAGGGEDYDKRAKMKLIDGRICEFGLKAEGFDSKASEEASFFSRDNQIAAEELEAVKRLVTKDEAAKSAAHIDEFERMFPILYRGISGVIKRAEDLAYRGNVQRMEGTLHCFDSRDHEIWGSTKGLASKVGAVISEADND